VHSFNLQYITELAIADFVFFSAQIANGDQLQSSKKGKQLASNMSPTAGCSSACERTQQKEVRNIMVRRVLSSSNQNLPSSVPIVGLGCSSFSGFFLSSQEHADLGGAELTTDTIDPRHPKVQEWIETIHFAIQSGITLLDTAPWYGHGTSEMVIGWAMERLDESIIPRDSLTLNTKVGRYESDQIKQFDFSYDTTLMSVQRSLTRMKCLYINVLQLHDPEFSPTLEILLEETIPAMLECRKRGYCKALGMTGYPLEVQHQILQATMERHGKNVWDQSLVYSHYNLHDTSLITHAFLQGNKSSFADYCQDRSIALMAAAPLSMGLLTHGVPPNWHPASVELKAACRQAAELCESRGVNISNLAIVVAMSNPRIPCTLLGMKDQNQVKLATEAAARFSKVSASETSQAVILKQVLSTEEYDVWEQLSDVESSPFGTLWKNGKYKWDGVAGAREFWKQISDDKIPSWQALPV
jgi:aryl-alcohol dehydrogenase-like predicted oxidoreductase